MKVAVRSNGSEIDWQDCEKSRFREIAPQNAAGISRLPGGNSPSAADGCRIAAGIFFYH
jgi:hypothetical protein